LMMLADLISYRVGELTVIIQSSKRSSMTALLRSR
jgi:hypothetical protein